MANSQSSAPMRPVPLSSSSDHPSAASTDPVSVNAGLTSLEGRDMAEATPAPSADHKSLSIALIILPEEQILAVERFHDQPCLSSHVLQVRLREIQDPPDSVDGPVHILVMQVPSDAILFDQV